MNFTSDPRFIATVVLSFIFICLSNYLRYQGRFWQFWSSNPNSARRIKHWIGIFIGYSMFIALSVFLVYKIVPFFIRLYNQYY